MKEFKIHAGKDSQELQNLLFLKGYIWADGREYPLFLDEDIYLFCYKTGEIYQTSSSAYFNKHEFKEISLSDLFERDNLIDNKEIEEFTKKINQYVSSFS